MSTASISYSSLKDASNEAKSVAKKIDKYADSLYDNVYKKLNNYKGSSTNLATVKANANKKIEELRTEQGRYETYAENLLDLRDECKEVDKAVRLNVSTLTASFKEAHGIRNDMVENAISYVVTGLQNKTAFGRWLGGKAEQFDAGANYLKSYIKQRYNYEGGKELIKGMLTVILEVAIAIVGVVAAIATFFAGVLTFGAVLVLAAALVGAGIALLDAWSNYENEKAAFVAQQNGDPALGRRRSNINSLSDFLRSSFMFGADGKTYHYEAKYNNLATGLEITSVVCSVITVISNCGKLLKNGFKWATGSKSATFKEIFTKDGMTKMFSGIKTNMSSGFKDLQTAVKLKNFDYFKKGLKLFGSDFLTNLKGQFANFDTIEDGAGSVKNILDLTKDFVNDGFDVGNIVKKVVLPSVGLAHIPGGDDMIVADDFYSIFDDINSKIIGSNLFSNNNMIKDEVLAKITSVFHIDISIPSINVPQVNIELCIV